MSWGFSCCCCRHADVAVNVSCKICRKRGTYQASCTGWPVWLRSPWLECSQCIPFFLKSTWTLTSVVLGQGLAKVDSKPSTTSHHSFTLCRMTLSLEKSFLSRNCFKYWNIITISLLWSKKKIALNFSQLCLWLGGSLHEPVSKQIHGHCVSQRKTHFRASPGLLQTFPSSLLGTAGYQPNCKN